MKNQNAPRKLIIIGLNNAGKTSLLYRLALGVNGTGDKGAAGGSASQQGGAGGGIKGTQVIQTQPTIGCNVEHITFQGRQDDPNSRVTFLALDLGGQESLRPLWSSYFQSSNPPDGIIFVVDSSCEDPESFLIARLELMNILILPAVRESVKAVLIFANKQDLSGSKTPGELAELMHLSEIELDWQIMPSCAISGEGLEAGLEWVASKLQVEEG